MFSEIFKFRPQIDRADLEKMVFTLSKRFQSVAKKFGSGLVQNLKGAGVTGVILGLVDKLLNPLKETQEVIERMLGLGDDLVTSANQFDTTAGKLFKLQQLGIATGLDPSVLETMIQKFQVAVAETKELQKDPTKTAAEKQTSVSNFIDNPDAADAFFGFIQSLQKLDKDAQVIAQKEVFGEKLIGKMSEFVNADFQELIKRIGLGAGTNYDPALRNLANLNDQKYINTARRNTADLLKKSSLIGPSAITAIDQGEKARIAREDKNLANFEVLKNAATSVEEIKTKLESMFTTVYGFIPTVVDFANRITNLITEVRNEFSESKATLKKVSDSPILRGIIKFTGFERVK